MRRFLLILVLVGLALSASAEDVMKISIDHFSVKVPLGWYAVYLGSPCLFMLYSPLEAEDDFQENGNLTIEKLPRKYTLQEYEDAAIKNVQKIVGNFKLIERKDNYHIYQCTMNEIDVVQMQMIFIKEKEAYVLTFSAKPGTFDQYRESFSAIAQSFTY